MNWEHLTYIFNLPNGAAGHKLTADDITKVADWYGGQGWELASTFDFVQQGSTTAVTFIFKRPKASAPVAVPDSAGAAG